MPPMTGRERFHAMLDFVPISHGFDFELPLWGQTYDRWWAEGMPRDVHVGNLMAGCEFLYIDRVGYLPLRVWDMFPPFAEEVLEEDERYITQRFADGHISRALKEGAAHGTRLSMDQYLSFPVTDRASWEDVKRRYNPRSPARYPEWWADVRRCLQGRDHPLAATPNACFGLYSGLRRLLGTELACTIFYDDPALAEEMLDYLTDYFIELLHPALDAVEIDFFNYFEDFAYKTGPLIGPNIFRQFLFRRYRRINDLLRGHGVKHIWLDSDGNTEILIPLLIEVGITCHWPLERAASMDPLKIRREYGHDLALAGGIDKRALAQGPQAIEEELYHHVPQLLADGGYMPTVDHAIPPDVSYENFLYYLDIKRKLLGA